jgi:hypothetical protein
MPPNSNNVTSRKNDDPGNGRAGSVLGAAALCFHPLGYGSADVRMSGLQGVIPKAAVWN